MYDISVAFYVVARNKPPGKCYHDRLTHPALVYRRFIKIIQKS